MFLKQYLNDFYYQQVLDNYDFLYLQYFDQENFNKVLVIFKKYNFYFIDDIILNYLELFELDAKEVEFKILQLQKGLGENYVYLIGNDLSYLDEIYR